MIGFREDRNPISRDERWGFSFLRGLRKRLASRLRFFLSCTVPSKVQSDKIGKTKGRLSTETIHFSGCGKAQHESV
jgi:hypothetical protein